MKLTCIREDLNSSLQMVQRAVSAKTVMPVLSGVYMEASGDLLTLHTTDLEVYMKESLPCKAELEGKAVVNTRLLSDISKNLQGELVKMESLENQLLVEDDKSKFVLRTMAVEDFPKMPEGREAVVEEIELEVLSNAINQVVKAASRDDKRPVLQGVNISIEGDVLNMVATDSYRLAAREIRGVSRSVESKEMIIPAKAMNEIARWSGKGGKIGIFEGEGQVRFEVGNTVMLVREIEGKFPNWRQLVPTQHTVKVKVKKEEITGAIKRISLVGSAVKIETRGSSILLSTEMADVGSAEEEIGAECTGEEMKIVFNSEFLMDGVSNVEGGELWILMTEAEKPALIRGIDDEDYRYVIMPIRQ